jgi:DNA-binding response OmpR family regulator
MLLWALEEDGVPVVGAADGRAALAWIGANRPALVLLDIGLPFVDGYGVAEGLRRAHGDAVPIVVMTAGTRTDESARRVGARDFVAKPFDLEELLAILYRILDRADR